MPLRIIQTCAAFLLSGLAATTPISGPAAAETLAVIRDPMRDPYAAATAEASIRFAIPEHWIRAVMQAESAGDPRAVSHAGAKGLMQVMPGTWTVLRREYGLGADPFDTRDNILAGTAYMRAMLDRYGTVGGMLAAYNAGPGRYDAYLSEGRPLPAESPRTRKGDHPMTHTADCLSRLASASALVLALAAPIGLSPIFATPAQAFLFGGGGRIVYDPRNHAENILSAARALEQINNQITQLQNEAQMLINQARNLASLPYSSLQALQQNVDRTRQLLSQAQNIAFDVAQIDQVFQQDYANNPMAAPEAQLLADARSRWENTAGGLQDALRLQAGVVGNLDGQRAELSALVGESQSAVGALQATQAGNQLLALQSQQIADLIAVVAANGRATALVEAERSAATEQGRVQRERFLAPGAGYQPGNARMFNN